MKNRLDVDTAVLSFIITAKLEQTKYYLEVFIPQDYFARPRFPIIHICFFLNVQ
jgi:hypothetical protein